MEEISSQNYLIRDSLKNVLMHKLIEIIENVQRYSDALPSVGNSDLGPRETKGTPVRVN